MCDFYITGSDQIWNPEHTFNHLDPVYFLNFVPDKSKCISYAASIGKESLSDEHIPCFSNLIKNINVISIRERKSIPFLQKCGVGNVVNVIDPTLLLTSREWKEIEVPCCNTNEFLLIYTHVMNNSILEIAEKLSTKLNLSKIFIGDGTLKKRIKPHYVSPEEFYGLFSHASFIITDSYHGTIFSIINEKPFYTLQKEDWAFRTSDILDKLGLNNRLLKSECTFPSDIPEINYEEIGGRLQRYRDQAISFLNSTLK